jgi:transcriptional regulator with XRE-family HTH domain
MYHKFKQYPKSLRRYRKDAGFTQRDVVRILGLSTTERLSRWENGSIDPNLENLLNLVALYKATPQELFPERWQAISSRISVSTAVAASGAHVPVDVLASHPPMSTPLT